MKAVRVIGLLAILAIAISAVAQEGFPLNGTWSGDYGTSPKEENRTQTTIVMSWDGKEISGLVDPGPDSAKFKVARLDSAKWMVHLEYDLKDKTGKLLPFTVDGKLNNASSRKGRAIVGTFTHGTTKGDFKITMDQ